jgi:guanylate kinase
VEKGPLVILSGPAGTGKSTLVGRLLRACGARLRQSISATTRPRRPGETDGKHYHFWTREHFESELKNGAFLEHAEVFGNLYGTPRSEVDPYRVKGMGVVLVIDVQGAEQIRRQYPEAVSIFLRAPSQQVYEERLRQRGTEEEAVLQRRLRAAEKEEARAGEYQYQVVNDNLDRAEAELCAILQRHFSRDCDAR